MAYSTITVANSIIRVEKINELMS